MADDLDSPRDVELSSLSAIYPEIQQPNPGDPYTIALDIPVNPSNPVTVLFPAAAEDALPPGAADRAPDGTQTTGPGQRGPVDSHELAHLPSVRLRITLGPRYPAEQPPEVAISANPPWLPPETARQLEEDAPRLWEETGRDMVGFTYIDHVQQAADSVFGLVDGKGVLEVDPRHKIAILDYDIQARRAAFEKETFDCGVCLEPKKGSSCHRMLDCGHVFCVACLQDFYNNAIREGDIVSVRCLAPNCAKEREKATSISGGKRKKPRTFINPSELLQIPLDHETVKRYVMLKYKTELESDKNTIYCPRPWCNGAARSKRHKKPQGLELAEVSDSSASEDEDGQPSKPYRPTEELLAICEECSFAFCSRCYQSWHGEFFRCTPRRDKEELSAEELASLEYMKYHTTPCPTCGVPAQKTHGCNHMICYRCQTHFCYLCSAWLDPGNPYQHFNEAPDGRVTGCYMRLWELEMGDGDDVGIGFAGGRAGGGNGAAPAVRPLDQLIPVIEEPDDEADEVVDVHEAGHPAAVHPHPQDEHANGGEVGIAREGPLVLRIAAHQPAPPGRGGPRARPAAPAAAHPVAAPAPRAARRGDAARAMRNQQPAARGGGAQPPLQQQQQQGARGPGGRGVGGVPAQRRAPRQGAGAGQRGRAGAGGGPLRGQNHNHDHPANQGERAPRRNLDGVRLRDFDDDDGELNPEHEAWVRQFVQLALNDEEDMLFGDDSDDGS